MLIWPCSTGHLSHIIAIALWVKFHIDRMQCCYNAVIFHKNIHKRSPIARPWGQGMGCLLWIQHLIGILREFLE